MYTRRELLEASKPHFGGGTSSTPVVPDEFKPLINASVGSMLGQQGANPIGAYNGANPMDVQGLTGSQQFGMGAMMGSYENNPLQYLAAQAAQRGAGMAGAGPTTGSYDPSGEMGLQDWANYMKPYLGTGAEMGDQQAPNNQFNDGVNVTPSTVPGVNYQGGPPDMSKPPVGSPAGGAGAPGGGAPGAPGSGGGSLQDAFKGVHTNMTPAGPGGNYTANQIGSWWTQGGGNRYAGAQPWTGQRDANGEPILAGVSFTGSNHEGANPELNKQFADAGVTPEQYRDFVKAGNDVVPQKAAEYKAAGGQSTGKDMWGNALPDFSKAALGNKPTTSGVPGTGGTIAKNGTQAATPQTVDRGTIQADRGTIQAKAKA